MKEIKLTQGKLAQVSDHRFEYLNQWEWYAHFEHGLWYAERKDGWPIRRVIRMHRQIMGVTDSKVKVDHRDGDGLNNVDENLRVCTNAQNARNRRKQSRKDGEFKGVYPNDSKQRPYRAEIRVNGVKKYLGSFSAPEEAARAYDTAAKEYFGDFARTNF